MTACCAAIGTPARRTACADARTSSRARPSRTERRIPQAEAYLRRESQDGPRALGGHRGDGSPDHAEAGTRYEDEIENHVPDSGESHDGEGAEGVALRPQKRARRVEEEQADHSQGDHLKIGDSLVERSIGNPHEGEDGMR